MGTIRVSGKGQIIVHPDITRITVLIDNLAETIRIWKEQGGTGILHTDSEGTMKKLKERGIF